MSTAYSSAKQQYIGNGVTTEWGFDFPIKKHSELKVYLKRSNSPQVLLEEGVDYSFVTENTIAFPIKTGEAKLQAADVLALQRESVFESEYNFSNQQRLEPEEVMHADDNLERQIQELKRDSESAIKVLPTSNVDPNMFFEQVDRVYGSVDNIDTVANDKANVDAVAGNITNVNTVAGDIESVKTVENNIESVVIDATNISHIKTVSGSIANVNKTAGSIYNVNVVAPSISSVNTVAANISSVNTAASNMAAIKSAPTAAANAAQSAANAANSATISANSAIWAEGTDAQVQALGGVHSSKVWAEQSTNANISLTNLDAAGQAKFDAKANVSNTVTTNTNQTITAKKTFTNTAQVVLLDNAARKLTFKSTVYDANAPENSQYYGILDFKDKNDYQVGRVEVFILNETDEGARIGCKNANGNWSFLEAKWLNGVALATAPTPPITEVGSGITTAKWVRDLLKTSGQAYTWSKKQKGYIKFSNGFILQWGHGGANRGNSYGWDTITYPIAFTSFQVAQATMYNNDTTWQGDASQTAQGSIKRIGLTGMQCYYTNSNGFEWVAVGF